jgi:hypothetical protein
MLRTVVRRAQLKPAGVRFLSGSHDDFAPQKKAAPVDDDSDTQALIKEVRNYGDSKRGVE